MTTCIYCTREANSREHWIPRGLGTFRGANPLLQICKDCNNRLGQLDQELARTGFTGFQRALHGIRGRHGPTKVSPFHYRTQRADHPTRMMMPAPSREHDILAEAYMDGDGRACARPLRQIVLKMSDGEMKCVPFARRWTADQLRVAVQERELGAGTLAEIYLEEDESFTNQNEPHVREIRQLLSSVFGSDFRKTATYFSLGDGTQGQLVLIAGVEANYLRAVAKVAFHYFLWACPVLKGNDPIFAEVRAFVLDGVGDWRDFVQLDAEQFLPILRNGILPRRTSHFFHALLKHDAASAFVQFFVGGQAPAALPPPAYVRLAKNPLIVDATYFTCHQACYYEGDASGRGGHDGEIVPIETWKRRIIAVR